MRIYRSYIGFSSVMCFIMVFTGCKKADEGQLPSIITSVIDIVTPVSAICKANINSDGGSSLSERGVCWSTAQLPVITDNKVSGGTGTGEFSMIITGLTELTEYYARAFATNRTGTVYGEELHFTTLEDHTGETGTIEDADGNIYQTTGIGSQFWTTENLKTTSFNDAEQIPLVTDDNTWGDLVGPGYCWYDNNEITNKDTYGALYNWYTVISSKLCPSGWHVPTDADWTALETFLGGSDVAGRKIRETGTEHWMSPNTGATNESGLTVLPGGMRDTDGQFSGMGGSGYLWTSTVVTGLTAWSRLLEHSSDSLFRNNYSISIGSSVRCVRD